jgi:RHS repeat-associated protein
MAGALTTTGSVYWTRSYKPWGEQRYQSGTALTSYGFTGQREENAVAGGIFDFKARWYDPQLGRFLSADTIIPGQGAMAWDRYSYANNNPFRYIDPSGHEICDADGYCNRKVTPDMLLFRFGITLSGEWTNKDKSALVSAALAIGSAFRGTGTMSVFSAFRYVFGGVNFEHVSYACAEGCWGQAMGPDSVRIYGAATNYLDPRLAVHELGHVFNARAEAAMANFESNYGGNRDNTPYAALNATFSGLDPNYANFPRRDDYENGFAGPPFGWQQSKDLTPNEEFADMFIGWTYNTWGNNPAGSSRSNWMNETDHMWFWTILITGWY